MNIHKGKGKLKNTSIMDIAMKDRNKKDVFFSSGEEINKSDQALILEEGKQHTLAFGS